MHDSEVDNTSDPQPNEVDDTSLVVMTLCQYLLESSIIMV